MTNTNTNTNTNNNNGIEIEVNGVVFRGLTWEQAQQLGSLAIGAAPSAPAEPGKPKSLAATAIEQPQIPHSAPTSDITPNNAQMSVINGVIRRAAKKGYTLKYYVDRHWVWFYNVDGKEAGKRNSRKDDTPEFLALGSVVTKRGEVTTRGTIDTGKYHVERSKKRGQLFVKF